MCIQMHQRTRFPDKNSKILRESLLGRGVRWGDPHLNHVILTSSALVPSSATPQLAWCSLAHGKPRPLQVLVT